VHTLLHVTTAPVITVEYPRAQLSAQDHMQIILNGSNREIPENLSAAALLQDLGLAGKRLALEINQEIVPRSTFENRLLTAGDQVEIVQAIGGG